jgi:hypothetical protein
MGRAFIRRGQRVARDEEVPFEEAKESKHRSAIDRYRAEHKAPVSREGSRTEVFGTSRGPAPVRTDTLHPIRPR